MKYLGFQLGREAPGLCCAVSREWGGGMKLGSPAAHAREVWGPHYLPEPPHSLNPAATQIKTTPAPRFY